ncbi:hypothetical protein Zmor_027083 [Zophobas morio]|uniref:Uncharacterized protein n=1 Tax=Zophobas morio TaxID=2755281 RepID=A0AA38M0L0_9CUCU|nr:hypothetical protein Zmor_027083 [Zophobas morio]
MPSCSTCVGAAVERAADGISYCSSCSRVIENDEFVAQIEFQESSGGAFSVCGTFVTNDGFNTSGAYTLLFLNILKLTTRN